MDTPQDTGAQIGALVESAMTAASRNRNWLSEKTGIPRTSLNRKLQGAKSEFLLSELILVARALDVPPSSLVPSELVPAAPELAEAS